MIILVCFLSIMTLGTTTNGLFQKAASSLP
jgi:hypothetical protein